MSNDGQDMSPIPSSSELSIGERIDRICGEFEDLLKAGKTPKIETYLLELSDDHRGALLEELLGLELDYRARAGDSFTSDEYLRRFPGHTSTVVDVVVSVRRQKTNEAPTDEFRPGQTPPAKKSSGSSHTTERSHFSDSPVRIGPYEILGPCGRGGMGVVYKAWHELFKQYRAIKVLPSNFDEEDISRFSMEIELAGRLNHPNIVRAHEAAREQGILYLVMEFVDGINLDHLTKHHKRLPLGLACEMIRQAAEGLQHAHEHFLVHRDIKPSNLMVNQQGQVKILDFGLARLHAEQNASRITKHGSVMGTLDFMAPEQWEDPMGATIQADIYSLGCTLYYLVTGTPPYGGEDYSHWIKKQEAHRKLPVPLLDSEHAEALQPIINRMMAKSRAERFTTPAEVVRALEPLADPSELKRYAETPVPKLSMSGISRTPIPTVNVSKTNLLGSGNLGQLAEQFSPDDSEPNSKEKTLKPHQSFTDLDSDRLPADGRPRRPWYKSRAWQSSLLVLVVVLLSFAAWSAFRPPQNVELAQQMGALPGLNGGWWFEEMPWYGPGVRKALMTALRNGESDLLGLPIEEFEERLFQADTMTFQNDLESISRELQTRLSHRERFLFDQLLIFHTSGDPKPADLSKILEDGHGISPKVPIDEETLAEYSATELHWLAALLHLVSVENSEYVNQTETVYKAAIAAYDETDDVESVLKAVAQADLSIFLGDLRDYTESTVYALRASQELPDAGLFHIGLRCQLADQYRRWPGHAHKVKAVLQGHPGSAEAWANEIPLAENHPLRAEIHERTAWFYVDSWQMTKAIREFHASTKIRQANQQSGNRFAWRQLLFNKQGEAMAMHFLGQDEDPPAIAESDRLPQTQTSVGAISIYHELIDTIHHPPTGLSETTKAEGEERLPNIFERQGDAYLFGPNFNAAKAAKSFDQAILEACKQDFDKSATLWFHLTRMYHKHVLALALAGDLSNPEVMKAIKYSQGEAAKYETNFRLQMVNDPKAFEKQLAAFALEQDVAKAVVNLIQENDLTGLRELIRETKTSKVNRSNIEVLLLVFRLLFDRHQQLEGKIVEVLGGQLIMFTDDMTKGDIAIRTKYLAPVFRRAGIAVPDLKPKFDAVIEKTN